MKDLKRHSQIESHKSVHQKTLNWAIWGFAFGYFAFYVPYSALAKALSAGLFDGMETGLRGFSILPVSVIASVLMMLGFLLLTGWWKDASTTQIVGINIPHPTRYTFASGICTSMIIATTTLAYTFDGVSIVFVMLLMRGGVLILAPMVDRLSNRATQWYSWLGLLFSLSALIIAFSERGGYEITLICAIDVVVYLLSYFTRLRFMSRQAKSNDPKTNRRYFVEEQLVAGPFLVALLGLIALIGQGPIVDQIRWGFSELWTSPMLGYVALVGILSQGTGICGTLIFLDNRENTYCVPVNRCSSILAGLCATYLLYGIFDQPQPSSYKLMGALCILMAILSLTVIPAIRSTNQKTKERGNNSNKFPEKLIEN